MEKTYKYKGKQFTSIAKLLKFSGSTVPYNTAYFRITRYGWDLDKALFTPVDPRHRKDDENIKVAASTITYRQKKLGWSYQKAASTPVMRPISKDEALKRQKESRRKYAQRNKDVVDRNHNLSYARRFIREFATLGDLNIAKQTINQAQQGKLDQDPFANSEYNETNPAQRTEYKRYRSLFVLFLKKEKDTEFGKKGMKDLLDLIDLRKKIGHTFTYKQQLAYRKSQSKH